LIAPVYGPDYGLPVNQFPDSTAFSPASVERFDKQYERRGPAFSHVRYNFVKLEEVATFSKNEDYDYLTSKDGHISTKIGLST